MKKLQIKKQLYALLIASNMVLLNGCSNKNIPIQNTSKEVQEGNNTINLDEITNYFFISLKDNNDKYYLARKTVKNGQINYYDYFSNELITFEDFYSFDYTYDSKIGSIDSLGKFIMEHNLKKNKYEISDLKNMYNIYLSEKKIEKENESLINITEIDQFNFYSKENELGDKDYYLVSIIENTYNIENDTFKTNFIYPNISGDILENMEFEENLFSYILSHSQIKKNNYTCDDLINIYNEYVSSKKEKTKVK